MTAELTIGVLKKADIKGWEWFHSLYIAKKYGVTRLESLLRKYIKDALHFSTALTIVTYLQGLGEEELEQTVLNFIGQ